MPLALEPCVDNSAFQRWLWSKGQEIRSLDDLCFDYFGTDITLYTCHGSRGNQVVMEGDRYFDIEGRFGKHP